jgi:alanyl-tRNA synthetase
MAREIMTEKLYYIDPRLQSFEARVLHREPAADRWAVVLDRTAFYPEGGGQPADRGRLNDLPVLDVQKRGEEIHHYLPGALETGAAVQGQIDWPRRFEFMQQHTGQHIVSASLIEAAGCATISAYLGERYTAVEIDAGSISEQQIEAAQTLANRRVAENLPVEIHWIRPEEAERFNLRKPPPEVRELRIVQINGVDSAACAGVHVHTTGEVGLIKYDGLEKIRSRLRLHWLIGERAFRDMREKDRLVSALNRELTCATADILTSVQELRNRLRDREQRIAQLEKAAAEARADLLLDRAETREDFRLVRESFAGADPSFVQSIYRELLERPKTAACVVNRPQAGQAGPGGLMQWWIGSSADLDLPWQRILPPLFVHIGGKGGGKGRSWQGMGGKPEGEGRFLDELREAVWEQLLGETNGGTSD